MKQILKTLSVYYVAYFILLMLMLGMLYAYPKVELHLLLNSCHSNLQDTIFKYYSMLAEWPLYVLALLPLAWKKKEITIFFALCELSGGAMVQILKRIFSAPRPVSVFDNYPDLVLPLVDGVHMHHSNSFPSGHTSTFFIFFTCCAFILAYHYLRQANRHDLRTQILFNLLLLLLLALAALGGYSRIYLSQHFLSDVCVGSMIGVTIPCLIFHLCKNKVLELNLNETK
ncbi:MAG: phosphatase PAP2 family protein [Bacteroidaceae bacterium]|nr:phosphatase PAP2 family protein [Bacteroidaceae bacterium]